jgi:hypothetical protein
MPEKKRAKATKKQVAARSKLARAAHAAKKEYDKLPPNMKSRARWNREIKKHL